MGNVTSEQYQKQYLSFVQRVQAKHVDEIQAIFDRFSNRQASISLENLDLFFDSLLETIAPSYTAEKRQILKDGWKTNRVELTKSQLSNEINNQIVTEFSFSMSPLKQHCIAGVKATMPVAVQINSPISSTTISSPPLCMVCVLDVSGSMMGDKLKFAKRAVCKVIKHLTLQDTFHFITYESRVHAIVQNGDLSDKADLKATVRAQRANGGTNICDALKAAATLIQDSPLGDNAQKRIFLFSDGDANEGSITDAPGLSELAKQLHASSGAVISTFGLGRDYNEAVMSGIAKNSLGEYYFIESAASIPVTMSKSIHGVLSLYGTNASLTLRGRGDGIVSKVFGKYANHDLSKPISIGDLRNNDKKRIIVELELSCKASTDIEQIVCEGTLTYDKIESENQKITNTVSHQLKINFSINEATVAASPQDNFVFIGLVMQRVASIDREIIGYLDRGDYDNSIRLKEQSLQILKDALPFDNDGKLPKVIQRVEAVLRDLSKKKNIAAVRKTVDYEAACEECDDDYGYACRSDSDEDCYSDEDLQAADAWSDNSYDSCSEEDY